MLPDLPTIAQAHEQRLKPLRWLAAELRLYGLSALITTDRDQPFLRVALDGASGDADAKVRVGRRDGHPCYVWAGGAADHPLFDPAGAARRLAVALRRERAGR